jgi:hypothetical protein
VVVAHRADADVADAEALDGAALSWVPKTEAGTIIGARGADASGSRAARRS